MEDLCKQIAKEHGLSREATIALIERTAADTLSAAFKQKVLAYFENGQLKFFKGEERDRRDRLTELPAGKIRKEVVRLFRYTLDAELKRRKASSEYEYLKTLRGTVLRGTIDRILEDGRLLVLFLIEEIFSCREVLGTCPVANQPIRERGNYRTGDRYFFFVTRVSLVRDGRLFRHVVTLSRSTPRLTEALLIRKTGHNGIKCIRRIAGKLSSVVSEERLPREAILAVGNELGERVCVKWKSSGISSAERERPLRAPTWA